MISRSHACQLISNHIMPLTPEVVLIEDALDVVLAEPIKSQIDVPPFDKSAMDGYALAKGETATSLKVVATIKAGAMGTSTITLGTTVKIMTGASVPENTFRVEKIENVTPKGADSVEVASLTGPSNICLQGEDIQAGNLLYNVGEQMTPLKIANAISCGIQQVVAHRVPRVGILVTGDELLNPGEPYSAGKIYNSNGPMLLYTLQKMGYTVVVNKRAGDDVAIITNSIVNALDDVDLLFISGSVSVGDFDYVRGVLDDIGATCLFQKVAIKPGKPVGCYTKEGKVVVALPGNPVAAYVSFLLFGLPALYRLQNSQYLPAQITVSLQDDIIRKAADREWLLPVKLAPDHSYELLDYHGSAHLFALSHCNGLLCVPPDKLQFKKGEKATIIKL